MPAGGSHGSGGQKCAFHFKIRESWRDRIRYFIYLVGLKMAPTAKDHEAIPLPAVFSGLYYEAVSTGTLTSTMFHQILPTGGTRERSILHTF